ncbi:hypothetical protein EBZ39_15080 [bacterium]|nr:hypothetical protein [bacterium]
MMLITFFFLTLALCGLENLDAFHVDNLDTNMPATSYPGTVTINPFFEHKKFYLTEEKIKTDPLALQQAARDALRYIQRRAGTHMHVLSPKHFSHLLSLEGVKNTLSFIANCIEEDKHTGRYRILEPSFLNKHFSCLVWRADHASAQQHNVDVPGDGRIRLTTYSVFNVPGNSTKTDAFDCALYAVRNYAIVKRFTKQQIVAGALEKKHQHKNREVLAWVSRTSLEEALMHGTVLVSFPDGKSRLLNVHVNNGRPYDKTKKDRQDQERYWFFKEIGGHTRGGMTPVERLERRKQVVFAGDLHNIGLGKLIAIRYQNPATNQPELRLGILADTGGAFHNNLYQLDFFAGLVDSHDALRQIIREVPIHVRASILYKRTV